MKSIRAVTLGCSKNRVDTEHLLSRLEVLYDIVPQDEDRDFVDYIMVNTCGFIGDAKEESIGEVFEAVRLKNEGRAGKVVVCGCLSERYAADMPKLIPEVDAWFGARDFRPLLKYFGVGGDIEHRRRLTTPSHYAYLKISEGCDRRCSYCAIPFIRGRHVSVPIEKLVEEATLLAGKGVRELILIAQDTTFYGLDLYHRRALGELLQKLSEIEGIEWLRIHYSYPADFPEDVLEQMAQNPKVCRYMDIPLQHISDVVLKNMHRGVDGEWTRELIRKMRERVPGIVLRTTMIVGHPGEGEKEFGELLDFVGQARFERLGAFTYSEEEGTYGAEHFVDAVPQEVKQDRLDRLMSLQKDVSYACNLSRVGSVERVIVDDYLDGVYVCRSEFESPEVDGEILAKETAALPEGRDPREIVGTFINVRITGADEYDLTAEIVR